MFMLMRFKTGCEQFPYYGLLSRIIATRNLHSAGRAVSRNGRRKARFVSPSSSPRPSLSSFASGELLDRASSEALGSRAPRVAFSRRAKGDGEKGPRIDRARAQRRLRSEPERNISEGSAGRPGSLGERADGPGRASALSPLGRDKVGTNLARSGRI
ncbi:hypothetical protein KM043_003832 [Ampulex compressa]|nr:hypothetical protein KM043_003832 [Ampulex compressa]